MPIKFYTPELYIFNNFSAHAIEFRGTLYPTCEHAYQAAKCTDLEGQEAIRHARSPLEAKRLANETYRAARDPDWGNKKVAAVEEILRAKLAQHPEAQEALRKSGHEDIVEPRSADELR
jgi:N-glycosidase YbiA